MKEVNLTGLRVWLGQPVQVTAQTGWAMNWALADKPLGSERVVDFHETHGPSGVHLCPFLAKFPNGHLIATYDLDPDAEVPVVVSGFQISKDGGQHWGRRYSMLMQHIPMIFIPKDNDSLLAVPSELMLQTLEKNEHTLVGPAYLFEHGGDRMEFVPDGVRVVDWPWVPLPVFAAPRPEDTWHCMLFITGQSALRVKGKLLVSAYCYDSEGKSRNTDEVEPYFKSIVLSSSDGGYTWRYLSTIATLEPSLASEKGVEGPNECSILQLADGDLMAVFRRGNGGNFPLGRCYSHDGGLSWTKAALLPAASVMPVMVLTANKTVALATGRPGLSLWLATDTRATNWQRIDLVAQHNALVPDASERIGEMEFNFPWSAEKTHSETSSYTSIVEMAPNKLLIIYDRDPEVKLPANSKDVSRVFVLPFEIERD